MLACRFLTWGACPPRIADLRLAISLCTTVDFVTLPIDNRKSTIGNLLHPTLPLETHPEQFLSFDGELHRRFAKSLFAEAVSRIMLTAS